MNSCDAFVDSGQKRSGSGYQEVGVSIRSYPHPDRGTTLCNFSSWHHRPSTYLLTRNISGDLPRCEPHDRDRPHKNVDISVRYKYTVVASVNETVRR